MIKSVYELKELGFVDDSDRFVRPLRWEELTGQESGVWFDYNEGAGDFCKCDNYSGVAVVDDYYNGVGELVYPQIISLSCDLARAVDVVDDDEIESIKGWGAPAEDVEALTSDDCKGAYFTLILRYDNGDRKTFYFFAPDGWN